jgi:Zn-dependent M28 family amino/carboxypeptidase
MLETAAALTHANARPKRSILFLAVFGEEKIMLGSRYYASHPLFPLDRTVAGLNLEVLGRTDAAEGPHENRIAMTGYSYSTVTDVVREAGRLTGIEVYRHDPNSDRFYTQSDNIAFAERGIPAHTLSTGYLYPDYHQPGDHWDKLNYPHLEKATRLVLLSALMLADSAERPRWNAENPSTERYREEAKEPIQ